MLARAASRLASSARAARAAAAAVPARPPLARRRPSFAPPPAAMSAPPEQQQRGAAASASASAAGAGGAEQPQQQQRPGAAEAEEPEPDPSQQLVQYVVLRRDLWRSLGWPLGPVVAQGAHAATAALSQALAAGSEAAGRYCSAENLPGMRKVVLEVDDEAKLRALAGRLGAGGVAHWLWVEQPEGYATALATWPAPRGEVAPHVKKGRLCKAAMADGAVGAAGDG
jgi:peptidyl-tRNA hydrolase